MNTTLTIGLLMADQSYNWDAIAQELSPHTIIRLNDWADWDEQALAEKVRACEIIVTGRKSPQLPESLAIDPGKLKLLAHCHGSIRRVISKHLISSGIHAVNWGDNVSGVAESAMAMLFACLKQLNGLDAFIRADWKNDQRIFSDFPATLKERDVGIYGFGPIGRHMARMLEPFGANIHLYDPFATDVPASITRCTSLDELFSSCQCISIHCGLNDATRGSVNRSMLKRLPQGGIVINTARGPIVVEQDLADLIAERRLLAGVDVIEKEDQWPLSPLAQQPSNLVLLTGHVICNGKGPGPTKSEKRHGLPRHTVANILALAKGEPLQHEITADIYDLKT